jgi:twitching motility protein PilT
MIGILKGRRGSAAVDRLKGRDWRTPEERDRLLELLAVEPGQALSDLAWMTWDRDPAVRATGFKLVRRLNDPDTVGFFARSWGELMPVARQTLARSMEQLAGEGWEAELEALLQHKSAKLREAALEILRASPMTPRIRRLLGRQLEQQDGDSRRQALQRLLDDPSEADPAVLEGFLTDPDEALRVRVVRALGARRDPRVLDLLAQRLEVETYSVQQELVNVLLEHARQGLDVTEHLLPLLSGGNGGLRHTALRVLAQMPDKRRVIREFIDYSRSLSGWVRQRALETMAEFGEDLLEPAVELFADPDPTVRAAAVFLASSVCQDRRLETAVLPLLRDPDWWVRVTALEVLGGIQSRAAVPTMVALLKDADTRWSALDALAMVRDPASLSEIVRLLREPEDHVRLAAVQVLGRFGLPELAGPLKTLCHGDPSVEVRAEAFEALRLLAGSDLSEEESSALKRSVDLGGRNTGEELGPAVQIMLLARERDASDVHFTVGRPPMLRVGGELVPLLDHDVLDPAATQALLLPLLSAAEASTLTEHGSVELCCAIPNRGRYRGSIYVDSKGLNGVFRVIPNQIPTLSDIGLPAHLSEMAAWHQGLVLIVGPAGSGKTTTLAALVNLVNETRQAHIISLEDPVEYVHHFKRSLINQRQLARDTADVHRALRAALREDPDVIVLGEMRDAETVRMALEASETGHLVIATMNGTSALRAVDRIINAFPPEEQSQTRMMLSDTLKVVIGQTLLPKADGKGRVAVFEVLMGLATVAAVIRENKTMLLRSIMQTGKRLGMRSHDDSLEELVERHQVEPELAYLRAQDKRRFEPFVSTEFLQGVLA